MKKLTCPNCGTKHCKMCNARRCKCPPKKMEIVTYCNCNLQSKLDYIKKRQDFHNKAQRILKNKKSKADLPPIDMSKILGKFRAVFTESNPAPPEDEEEDLLEAAIRQEKENRESEEDKEDEREMMNDGIHMTPLDILTGSISCINYVDGERHLSLNLYIDDDDDQCNGMQDMLEVFAWMMDEKDSTKTITLERDEDGILRLTIKAVRPWHDQWANRPAESEEEE